MEWYKTYGKVYGLYILSKPRLTVADPELIKQILVKDFDAFRNRQSRPRSNGLVLKNMSRARDDDWKRVRTIASPAFRFSKVRKIPAFRFSKVRKMYGLINHCCEDFLNNLDKDVSNGMNEVKLGQIMGAYSMDVIASCAFATKTNTYTDPNNPFTTNAFNIINVAVWKGIGTLTERKFFVDFTRSIIKKRRDNKEIHNDFLQLLMDVERPEGDIREAGDANEAHHVNEGKDEITANAEAFSGVFEKKLTENEILAQCLLFFIAGYETISTTLSFCTYELAINPGLQDRLYEEIKGLFPYRQLYPVYAIHHDPDHYPDPFTFNPDRFMPENRGHIKAYTYLPFGSGPRNCIGMRFALLEAKLALAKISQKFRFSRVTDTDVPVVFNKGRPICQAKRLVVGIQKR
ncbi:unnamed protein product [Oppiella nova]|uniref:Cytochrome P450 n=1 Tax=Oppiella nova TaxID=334625 RepID=A0A7R9QLL8_9ACAR|nr:unnamed protein product [Oppiella nova]CAG2168055.1 unnamed protein product [Oppiella nova]